MFKRIYLFGMLILPSVLLASTPWTVYQKAKKQDPSFKKAYFVKSSVNNYTKIANAALLPQINAGYSYSKITNKNPIESKYSQESKQITASQALFNVPAYLFYLETKELKKASESNFQQARQDLILRSLTSYLNVLEAHDVYLAQKSEVKEFKERLDEITERAKIGAAIQSDVAKANAAYAMSQSKLSTSKTHIIRALDNIAVMTKSRPHQYNSLTKLPSWVHPSRLESGSYLSSPLLKSAQLNTKALQLKHKQSISQHMPSVVANASWSKNSYEGNTSAFLRSGQQKSTSIAVELPIFSGGALTANAKRDNDEYQQARYQTVLLTRQMQRSYQSFPTVLKTYWQSMMAAQKSVESSLLDVTTIKANYQQGRVPLRDLLDSVKQLNQNKQLHASTRYTYLKEYFNYLSLIGKLDSKKLSRINQLFLKPVNLPEDL